MKKINLCILLFVLFSFSTEALNSNLPKASITFEKTEYTLIKDKKEDITPTLEHAKSCIWSIPPQDSSYVKLYPFGKNLVIVPLKSVNHTIPLKCTTSQVEDGYQAETKYITLNLKNQYYLIISNLISSPRAIALIVGEKLFDHCVRKRDKQRTRYVEFYIDPKYINSAYDAQAKTILLKVLVPETDICLQTIHCPIDTTNQRCIYLRLNNEGNKTIHTRDDNYPLLSYIYYGYPRNSRIEYKCKNPEFGRWFTDLSHFHMIGCPTRRPTIHVYDGNQKEITNEYGKSWFLYKYDTKERSLNGPDNAWKQIDFPNETLELGHGYLLGFLDGTPTPTSIIFHSDISTNILAELSQFYMDIKDYSKEAHSPLDANWYFLAATSYQEAYAEKTLCTQHYCNGIYQIEQLHNHINENEGVFIQTPPNDTILPFSHNKNSIRLSKSEFQNQLSLVLKNKQQEYYCILALDKEATSNYDIGHDIISLNKLETLNHNGIYFLNHQKALVQCYAPYTQNKIPILVCSNSKQNYTLHFNYKDPNIQRCILTDSLLIKQVDLCQQDYTFQCDSGHFKHRFSIAVNGNIKVGLSTTEEAPFYWKTTPHYLHLYNLPINSTISIYTATGQCILNKEIKTKNKEIYSTQSGFYICQIRTPQKSYPFVWID